MEQLGTFRLLAAPALLPVPARAWSADRAGWRSCSSGSSTSVSAWRRPALDARSASAERCEPPEAAGWDAALPGERANRSAIRFPLQLWIRHRGRFQSTVRSARSTHGASVHQPAQAPARRWFRAGNSNDRSSLVQAYIHDRLHCRCRRCRTAADIGPRSPAAKVSSDSVSTCGRRRSQVRELSLAAIKAPLTLL